MLKEVWEMTIEDWLSKPRTWFSPPRYMTVDEWRHNNGYSNPLDDHGDFRHPNGISKTTKKRIDSRTNERMRSMVEGSAIYHRLLEEGQIPIVTEERHYRADGLDSETILAKARIFHRSQVRKAISEGKLVPDVVLVEYQGLHRAA